ncbi:MAG: ATP-dependent DNA ligase [Egibacteraceae bacterium]
MQLATLVEASSAVAGTRSRTAKTAALASALQAMEADEVAIGASYLAGRSRPARLDVGWAAVGAVEAAPRAVPQLRLTDVDQALHALPATSGEGSRRARHDVLTALFGQATTQEQSFLRGLILGELRQGALEGIVAQAIAQAWNADETLVRRALMLEADLGEVARAALEGGSDALRAFTLELFRPVRPMLAQTSGAVADAVDGEVRVEWKLDGARVQVHRRDERVAVYSRSLFDVTPRCPEVVAAVADLDVRAIILDGEMLVLGSDGKPLAFQDTMGRIGRDERSASEPTLTPFFFDCLHLDGVDLLDEPLTVRTEALTRAVPDNLRVPGVLARTTQEAERMLHDALERGHEGVVVKERAAPYAAGRRGAAWRKVKPVHTLDLVVLAVEWGSGRRQGWLSNLHLGARAPDSDGFVMLGKTFKGMTDAQLAWQTEHLLNLETHRTGHVVHVRPDLVVEVAFDGVQTSSRYPGGVTLRFARIKGYRPDKHASEADTLDSIRSLRA